MPTAEALAVSDRLANSDCKHNTPESVRDSAADCALCRAAALDAFAEERVREAVVAFAREAYNLGCLHGLLKNVRDKDMK